MHEENAIVELRRQSRLMLEEKYKPVGGFAGIGVWGWLWWSLYHHGLGGWLSFFAGMFAGAIVTRAIVDFIVDREMRRRD